MRRDGLKHVRPLPRKAVHVEAKANNYVLSDLPLIKVEGGKGKKFKEFFRIINNVRPEAPQEVKDIMNDDPTCVGRFPGDLRPGDALRESCHVQVVTGSASNSILQFFHSSMPLPRGVVKVFCRGTPCA